MQAAVVRPVLLSSLVAAVTFFVGTIGLTTPVAAFLGLTGLAALAYPRGWNDDA